MKNIVKKLLFLILLTPLLFLTGCGALSSLGAGGDKATQPVYKNYVSIDSTTNSVGVGDELEYEDEGINKKWGVALSSSPDHTAESVSEGLKTTTTFTGADLGLSATFAVNFLYEKRSSTVGTSKSETRSGSESTTYLGGSNTNYEGQFRILESDYRLGVHIPQQTNHGVVVAVIGTGIAMDNPSFQVSNFWTNSGENCTDGVDNDNNTSPSGDVYIDDCYGYDFADNKPISQIMQWDDILDSHETQVAGLITGRSIKNGHRSINPKAVIMNLKVFRDSDRVLDINAVIKSIEYSADNIEGKCIINTSFGIVLSRS